MSSSYGPVPLTAGIVTFQDVDASAEVLVIQNASPIYDLAVSFSPSKPPAVTTMSGFPWMGIIQAGAPGSFHPPRTGWLGRVWFCPIDASRQSAIVGSASGYGYAYVTAYLVDEIPDGAVAIPRRVDVGNQPRIVHVPITTQHWNSLSAPSPAVLGNQLELGNQTVPAALVAGGLANIYLYYGHIQMYDHTATGFMNFRLELQFRDVTHANLGSAFLMAKGVTMASIPAAGAGFIGTPWIYGGDVPLDYLTTGGIPATATEIALYFVQEGGAGSTGFAYTIVWNVDSSNTAPPADIGNQALFSSPGAPRF